MANPCHHIGAGGGDYHQIRVPRQTDMPHFGFIRQGKQISIGFIPAQSANRKGGDKLATAFCQDHPHCPAFVFHAPDESQGFIGGNPAADNQQDLRRIRMAGIALSDGGLFERIGIARVIALARWMLIMKVGQGFGVDVYPPGFQRLPDSHPRVFRESPAQAVIAHRTRPYA